ncbi:MAG TPA: O-antigen ligase family protein [Vicinamibacterales bacterium]
MSTAVLTLVTLGTLAFGAVYPWAYAPLFAAAATIGVVGLKRYGIPPALRPVAAGLLTLWAIVAIQLVPLPAHVVHAVSPSTTAVVGSYSLGFADNTAWLPLSIDPARTRVAVVGLGALGLYVLGLPALLDGRRLRFFPRGLALVAVPLALFAVYTREHNNGLIYGFWRPLDGGGADQAGPFINRNHFGGWILMALCVMVGWLLGSIERAFPTDTRRRRGPIVADDDVGAVLLMGTAVVLGAISLFWVVSRSAIASFGVAIAVFAWLALKRRHLGTVQRSLVMVALGVVLVVGVSWRGLDTLVPWFLDERSLLSRVDAWRDGWGVVRDFPLLGTGLNTYSPAMLLYQTRNPGFHMAQAHNDYLQLLAEGGAAIAIAAMVTAVLLIRAIQRTLRAARIEARGYWIRAGAAVGLMTIAFQELVEFSLQIPANAFLFCTLAAIAVTRVRADTRDDVMPRGNIDVVKGSAGAVLS